MLFKSVYLCFRVSVTVKSTRVLVVNRLSKPYSEFTLTGFKTISVLYKFGGEVPALYIVLFGCLTFFFSCEARKLHLMLAV